VQLSPGSMWTLCPSFWASLMPRRRKAIPLGPFCLISNFSIGLEIFASVDHSHLRYIRIEMSRPMDQLVPNRSISPSVDLQIYQRWRRRPMNPTIPLFQRARIVCSSLLKYYFNVWIDVRVRPHHKRHPALVCWSARQLSSYCCSCSHCSFDNSDSKLMVAVDLWW
jgi:hypothetical protein